MNLFPLLEGKRRPNGLLEIFALFFLGMLGRVYGLIQEGRLWAYQRTVFSTYTAPCPVISVGNLSAGGTGKTPMVIWLVDYFQKQGRRVAVVSRGYRQRSTQPVTLVANPNGILLWPPQAADEAVLVALKQPGVTVLTGSNRKLTIQAAIEQFSVDLVIMDDAFQHLPVARQLDLVLLDSHLPLTNGQVLPGGMLREFPHALQRCDGLILTRAFDADTLHRTKALLQPIVDDKPVASAIHRPKGWIQLADSDPSKPTLLPLDALNNCPVLVFCGIAKPDSFRRTIESLDLSIQKFTTFSDHHPYDERSLQQLYSEAEEVGATVLVCTEKDAVKIRGNRFKLPVYALSIELHFTTSPTWLLEKLRKL
ncbi:MAG: tetraacyldisaccharide 4'-kinase [Magnetococcales bacterium]|nr:tetraacyldisaccharide 4'-kinase [Magnetococcales bacterium]